MELIVRTLIVRIFIVRAFTVRTFIVRTVRTFIVRAFIVRAFIVHLSGHLTKIVAPIAHMFSDITKAQHAAVWQH